MCSAFEPDFRYDTSKIKLIGNVFCLNTICSDIVRVPKKTFQSLEGRNYKYHQCSCRCQVRNLRFGEQTNSFVSSLVMGYNVFERRNKKLKMLLKMCIVQYASTRSVFTFQLTKIPTCTTVKSAEPALNC